MPPWLFSSLQGPGEMSDGEVAMEMDGSGSGSDEMSPQALTQLIANLQNQLDVAVSYLRFQLKRIKRTLRSTAAP